MKKNKISDETKEYLLGINDIVKNELQWNICLCKVNNLRAQLQVITPVEERINVLTTNYPKFIWKLTASYEEYEIYFFI